jgi:hypothetical protein
MGPLVTHYTPREVPANGSQNGVITSSFGAPKYPQYGRVVQGKLFSLKYKILQFKIPSINANIVGSISNNSLFLYVKAHGVSFYMDKEALIPFFNLDCILVKEVLTRTNVLCKTKGLFREPRLNYPFLCFV